MSGYKFHTTKYNALRFIILCGIILNASMVIAQNKIIKLDKNVLNIPANDYNVISVIDARNQGECIGYILKGNEYSDYRQTAAYFDQPFCTEIQDIFSRSLPVKNEGTPLILRINKFLLSEYAMPGNLFNIVEVNITFIKQTEGNYYEIYQCFNSSERGGLNGSGPVVDNIVNTISMCFNEFLLADKKGTLISREIPVNQLHVNTLSNIRYPIEHYIKPARGIYYSFRDFINYQADTLKQIEIEYFPKTEDNPEMANIVLANDHTWPGNIWGFSDGNTNFIRINNNYYPIYLKDSTFRFFALREGTKLEDLSPYIAGAIFAGVIGAMFGFVAIPVIPETTKNEILECQIELNSGQIMPVNLIAYKEMNSRTILYMTKYQKAENEMEVYLDGEYKCTLTRNTYYFLKIPPDKTQVELCLKSKHSETCETFKPIPYDAGVYICEAKNNKPPEKSEAKSDVRKGILDKIFSEEITRKCPDK